VDEIGKILPALFRKQICRAEPYLLDILLPLWPRIAGKTIAQHSQPTLFTSGVLTLAADCTTWGTQLRHMTEEIRAEINSFLGQSIVRELRIKTMTHPSLFSHSRPLGGTTLPAMPRPVQTLDTTSIADPEIARALGSSYSKYFNRPGR
jgi:hypothetical protein